MLKTTRLLIAVLAAALTAASVFAQDPKLVKAGKKEGKVTVYGSLETDSAEAVFKIFRQKTGIDLEYWRASSTKVMDRALTEYRAGKPRFDVILTNDNPMQIMSREGIFANYESPSAKEFPRNQSIPSWVRATAMS